MKPGDTVYIAHGTVIVEAILDRLITPNTWIIKTWTDARANYKEIEIGMGADMISETRQQAQIECIRNLRKQKKQLLQEVAELESKIASGSPFPVYRNSCTPDNRINTTKIGSFYCGQWSID